MLRPVTDDPQFISELGQFLDDVPNAQNIIDGLEWILCRHPKAGYESRHRPIWYFPLQTDPSYCLFYSFDEEVLYFFSIVRLAETNGRSHRH
jgi:hypothetical protein